MARKLLCPAALLLETVVGGIDDTPFARVPRGGERGEDHTEIAPGLGMRGGEQAVDVLEQAERGVLRVERVEELVPQLPLRRVVHAGR